MNHVVFVLSTPVQLTLPSTMNVVKELIVLSSKEESSAFIQFLILLCCFYPFYSTASLTYLTAKRQKVQKRSIFKAFNSTLRNGCGSKDGNLIFGTFSYVS